MGGVSASVLLKDNLTSSQKELLARTLNSISSEVQGEDFWVNSTTPINGSYQGEPRPFVFYIDTVEQHDDPDLKQIRQKLNFDVTHEISISANANGQDDPKILGELISWISKTFNGFIDFDGLLLPNQYYKDNGYLMDTKLKDVKPYINLMKDLIPGRLVEIEYKTANDTVWAYHIGDNEFLKNWLESDEFKMVK